MSYGLWENRSDLAISSERLQEIGLQENIDADLIAQFERFPATCPPDKDCVYRARRRGAALQIKDFRLFLNGVAELRDNFEVKEISLGKQREILRSIVRDFESVALSFSKLPFSVRRIISTNIAVRDGNGSTICDLSFNEAVAAVTRAAKRTLESLPTGGRPSTDITILLGVEKLGALWVALTGETPSRAINRGSFTDFVDTFLPKLVTSSPQQRATAISALVRHMKRYPGFFLPRDTDAEAW